MNVYIAIAQKHQPIEPCILQFWNGNNKNANKQGSNDENNGNKKWKIK